MILLPYSIGTQPRCRYADKICEVSGRRLNKL